MNLTGKRVLIFGDSQAAGLTSELRTLFEQAGATVGASTHTGMSLRTAYTTLPDETTGYDMVILSFGGNNPPSNRNSAIEYMDGLLAQMEGKEVFWISVLPVTDQERQVSRGKMETWQKEHLPSKGVRVLDGRKLTEGIRRPDGLHLSVAGYRLFAQRLFDSVILAGGFPWQALLVGVSLGTAAAVIRKSASRRRSLKR